MDLIVYFSVELTALSTQGRSFPWPRLPCCPACRGRRVWGHGFASRYFDGISEAVWTKRWRCPDCHAVHTMRPRSHWRGFWASAAAIVSVLRGKLCGRKWVSSFSRQRQQYWWRGYQRQSRFSGAVVPWPALVAAGIIVATHSLTHRAIRPFDQPAHRIFAVTAAYSGP